MQLIYISHLRFPSEKTHSWFAMRTCEEFARGGMQVELWIPRRSNKKFAGVDPFEHHGVERNFVIRRIPAIDLIETLGGDFSYFLMRVTFQLSASLYCLWRLMRRGAAIPRPIFYFHDLRDAFLFSFFRCPMFLEIHDFYKSSVALLNRLALSRMKGLIVTNRLKIAALTKDFGISEERILHQPNAVDIEKFEISLKREDARRRLGLPTDKRLIVYTGGLFAWKGIDTLFEAAQFFSGNEMVYFVGGTDEDIQRFNAKCQTSNIKNVVIIGRRPHEEIPFWLRAADILVLPNSAKFPESKYETSPVKLFEYMASGRPIVASDLPSLRDVVDDSMVWFCEPDNPKALADAIHAVLDNPEEVAKRSKKAQEEAEKYTWERRFKYIFEFIETRLSNS